jgi:quercetin dioxygenase-like cupin family protein
MDVEWLDFTNLGTAAFFWAEDAAQGAEVLRAWNRIVRMKGVFQAKVPEQGYDLNYSYIAIGPHAKYVTHSHATPEFYYVLSGKTEWIVDGEVETAVAGDLYFHAPYADHEMRVLETGEPMRAITGSWAPFGDRSVFEQPFLLNEPLPAQRTGAALAADFDFHRFDVKRDLEFPSR